MSKVVVIASVLKPIDDTRMYEKLGLTFQTMDNYDVNIVGFSGKRRKELKQYPLFRFDRKNFKRLLAPLTFLKFLFNKNPDIVIVCTYELLLPAALYKLKKPKTSLIYDIRENYYLNALHSGTEKYLVRKLTAHMIHFQENIFKSFIDKFILAEKIYEYQLSFPSKERTIILENKYHHIYPDEENKEDGLIIFTGTLSRQGYIFECIEMVGLMNRKDKKYHLIIAGFSPDTKFRKELTNKVADLPIVELRSNDIPLAHEEIIRLIKRANYGFIGYEDKPHLLGKIPTKFFEYTALELPVILFRTTWLNTKLTHHNAGIYIKDPEDIGNFNLQKVDFYGKNTSEESLWTPEYPYL